MMHGVAAHGSCGIKVAQYNAMTQARWRILICNHITFRLDTIISHNCFYALKSINDSKTKRNYLHPCLL